ncbi:MAG: hypothetical protein ACRED1_01445 [Limisphaerales bacterium]
MTPITIKIPPAGTQSGVFSAQVSGKYFLVTATTGAFRVITNAGDEYSFDETGSGFGSDASPMFGKLTFYNDGGTIVTLTFYVSLVPIKTPDVTVQSSVTVNTQLTNTLAGCAAAGLSSAAVVTIAANTAKQLSPFSTTFRKLIVLAFRAFGAAGAVPTANTGQVMMGVTNNQMPIVLNPGDVWTFDAPTGAKYDLSGFYISAPNAGDGVLLIYS